MHSGWKCFFQAAGSGFFTAFGLCTTAVHRDVDGGALFCFFVAIVLFICGGKNAERLR